MVSTVGTIATTIIVVAVVTWALRVVNILWLRPKKLEKILRQKGFNGNSYRFLFGDLKDYFEIGEQVRSTPIQPPSHDISCYVVPYVHHIIHTYGKRSFVWFGPSPRLNITDPELIQEILSTPSVFHKTHSEPILDSFIGGLVVHNDEKWAKHRRIINPAFHQLKLKNIISPIYSSCDDMIKKIGMQIQLSGSSEVDVRPYIDDLAGDVISRAAFGSNDAEGRKIFQLLQEQAEITIQRAGFLYLPGWRYLPTKLNKRFNKSFKETESLLKQIIRKREKANERGEANNDDLLGILLESNSREIKEEGIGMSMKDVMEECKLFFFAGSETTSNLILWTMVVLSMHPNWQVRAREEVLEVLRNKKASIEDLNHLRIVTMILHEVLRLYPPVPMVVRAIYKEAKLGNTSLPAGTQFILPIIKVHHDRELWGEDAYEFKPERFSGGVLKATNGKLSFLPFTGGPRICIGQNFAVIEAKMAIAMFLQNYSFELSPSYKHSPKLLFTLPPEYGVPLMLHKIS